MSEWSKSKFTADEEILNQERRKTVITVMIDTEKETSWYTVKDFLLNWN